MVYAIYLAPENRPELEEPEAIMVSVVDAPTPQIAKADPTPEVPQPVTETPPTGTPEGAQTTQAPRQGPPPDQILQETQIEYLGARPMPNYPMASRRMREEGRVVVLVEINTQGLVERATVDSSSGFPRLDESALAAARKARMKPYSRNGVAYPAKAKIPFDFVMRN